MTQVEYVSKLIRLGCFDFFGLGTDKAAAGVALEVAAQVDAADQLRASLDSPAP